MAKQVMATLTVGKEAHPHQNLSGSLQNLNSLRGEETFSMSDKCMLAKCEYFSKHKLVLQYKIK